MRIIREHFKQYLKIKRCGFPENTLDLNIYLTIMLNESDVIQAFKGTNIKSIEI